MTRFTDRVERDLSQISDRATPSSTAWEAIQQRIDEQDTQPHSERTMEVIMLDPDTNRLSKRPRTGLLVAACLAAAALVGGLVVIGARDNETTPADLPEPTVPAVEPAIGGDPEAAPVIVDPEPPAEPDAAVDPTDEVDGEVLPPVEPASAGSAGATCLFGPPTGNGGDTRTILEQTCTFDDPATLPFEAPQDIELAVLDTRAVEAVGAAPFTSIADSGMLTAGYSYADGGLARFVGVARGSGDYDGQRITITGLGQGSVDATYDWTTDTTFATPPGASDASSEVAIECELTNFRLDDEDEARVFDQACTFSGDDPGYVPGPLSGPFRQFDTDPSGNGVRIDDFTYFTTELGDDVLFSGLVTVQGQPRFVSVWPGTGDQEGMLIHGVARVDITPEPTADDPQRLVGTGVIYVTALSRSL